MDTITPGPIRITVLNGLPIVVAGLRTLLKPYQDVVEVVDHRTGSPLPPVDVVLHDTAGSPQLSDADIRMLLRGSTARLAIFGWPLDAKRPNPVHAGAVGYVSVALDPAELVAAIQRVHAGHGVIGSGQPVKAVRTPNWPGAEQGLTQRESEMVELIGRGLTNQEIAEECHVSINSVKTYIRTAYQKMGVNSRTQAVLWGLAHGFDLSEPVDALEPVGASRWAG